MRCTSGGLWNMVRRLLENSFMSLRISCFISGGRLAKSSELMSIELGSSHTSPWDMKNKLTLVSEDSYTINVKTVTHMWTETQGDEFYWIYKEEFVKEKLQKYVNILGRWYQFGALQSAMTPFYLIHVITINHFLLLLSFFLLLWAVNATGKHSDVCYCTLCLIWH